MIYLFKCLTMFLTRALFPKHTLLATAKGSTVFWTHFFSLRQKKKF